MKKNLLLIIGLLFSLPNAIQAQLFPNYTWTPGQSTEQSVTGLISHDGDTQNSIISDVDPFDNISPIWVTTATTGYPGFGTDYLVIDSSKTYRFSIWVKQEGSLNSQAVLYLRKKDINGNTDGGHDVTTSNFSLPELNKWFLLVGFIRGSGDSNTYTGGLYGLDNNPNLVSTLYSTYSDFTSNDSEIQYRPYTHTDQAGNVNDKVHWFDPKIDEVTTDSVDDLLNTNNSDTQPPTAPTLSSNVNTDITADFSWSGATDNVGVTGYKIFKDGSLEATLGNISAYQVTGLTASTTYNFTATALDAAGNESAASNAVSITTNSSGGGSSEGGTSVWTETNSVASYTGDVAIGTGTVPSGYKMAIDGKLITEEVKVQLSGNWPDYVFEEDYDLLSLEEIKKHIEEKGHLPNIPSAEEVEKNGLKVGEMNRLLLEKIEELTLYILELKTEIEQLKLKQ